MSPELFSSLLISSQLFSDFHSSSQLFSAFRSSCQLTLCLLISSLLFSHLLSSSHISSADLSFCQLVSPHLSSSQRTQLFSSLAQNLLQTRISVPKQATPTPYASTEKIWHREPLHTASFCTEKFVHREVFTHSKLLHTEAFTQRSLYTALTHSKPPHREAPTQKSFYTEKLLHTEASTHTETFIAPVRNLEWVKKCKELNGINLECPPVRMPPPQTWNDSVLIYQNSMCVLLQNAGKAGKTEGTWSRILNLECLWTQIQWIS